MTNYVQPIQQPQNIAWLLQRSDWRTDHPPVGWPVWVQHAATIIPALWDGANWIASQDQRILVGVTLWRFIA